MPASMSSVVVFFLVDKTTTIEPTEEQKFDVEKVARATLP
jgi:hypothetical protein